MNGVLNPVQVEQNIRTPRHAERTARALTEELRAWQSLGASVRTMYGAPGGAV